MNDLTPEIIEAIPSHDIPRIRQLCEELHESTVGILETPLSSKDIEREEELRTALKLKLDEAMGYCKQKIADFEAIKGDLRTKKGYQTSDEKRLNSYKWSRIIEEKKEDRLPRPPPPQ